MDPLGASLTTPIATLTDWAETHVSQMLAARDGYDIEAGER